MGSSFKIKFSKIEGHTLSSYSATVNELMILFLRRMQPHRSSLCLLDWGVGDTFQSTAIRYNDLTRSVCFSRIENARTHLHIV